jgi:hypothetical protein
MALGVEMEKFGTAEAMADDQKVADVYAKKGAKVFDLDEATALSAELLKHAESIPLS